MPGPARPRARATSPPAVLKIGCARSCRSPRRRTPSRRHRKPILNVGHRGPSATKPWRSRSSASGKGASGSKAPGKFGSSRISDLRPAREGVAETQMPVRVRSREAARGVEVLAKQRGQIGRCLRHAFGGKGRRGPLGVLWPRGGRGNRGRSGTRQQRLQCSASP